MHDTDMLNQVHSSKQQGSALFPIASLLQVAGQDLQEVQFITYSSEESAGFEAGQKCGSPSIWQNLLPILTLLFFLLAPHLLQ